MKRILGAALLTALSAPAFAENENYLAFDVGTTSMNNAVSAYQNTANVYPAFPNPGNFRFAFGHQFNPNFATEVAYTKFGESKIDWGGTNGYETLSASSFQFTLIGSYPVTESVKLLGKLGLASNKAEYLDVDPANNTTRTASYANSAMMYGFGAQIKATENFSIRAMYDDYGNFRESNGAGATTFTIGFVLGF